MKTHHALLLLLAAACRLEPTPPADTVGDPDTVPIDDTSEPDPDPADSDAVDSDTVDSDTTTTDAPDTSTPLTDTPDTDSQDSARADSAIDSGPTDTDLQDSGTLDTADTDPPFVMPPAPAPRRLENWGTFMCWIDSAGTVACWGRGNRQVNVLGFPENTPIWGLNGRQPPVPARSFRDCLTGWCIESIDGSVWFIDYGGLKSAPPPTAVTPIFPATPRRSFDHHATTIYNFPTDVLCGLDAAGFAECRDPNTGQVSPLPPAIASRPWASILVRYAFDLRVLDRRGRYYVAPEATFQQGLPPQAAASPTNISQVSGSRRCGTLPGVTFATGCDSRQSFFVPPAPPITLPLLQPDGSIQPLPYWDLAIWLETRDVLRRPQGYDGGCIVQADGSLRCIMYWLERGPPWRRAIAELPVPPGNDFLDVVVVGSDEEGACALRPSGPVCWWFDGPHPPTYPPRFYDDLFGLLRDAPTYLPNVGAPVFLPALPP